MSDPVRLLEDEALAADVAADLDSLRGPVDYDPAAGLAKLEAAIAAEAAVEGSADAEAGDGVDAGVDAGLEAGTDAAVSKVAGSVASSAAGSAAGTGVGASAASGLSWKLFALLGVALAGGVTATSLMVASPAEPAGTEQDGADIPGASPDGELAVAPSGEARPVDAATEPGETSQHAENAELDTPTDSAGSTGSNSDAPTDGSAESVDTAKPSSPSLAEADTPGPATPTLLEQELSHMAELRAIAGSDPARAVRMADEGHERFAGGVFWQEREAIAIVALQASGQADSAQTRAKAFLDAHPGSVFAESLALIAGP